MRPRACGSSVHRHEPKGTSHILAHRPMQRVVLALFRRPAHSRCDETMVLPFHTNVTARHASRFHDGCSRSCASRRLSLLAALSGHPYGFLALRCSSATSVVCRISHLPPIAALGRTVAFMLGQSRTGVSLPTPGPSASRCGCRTSCRDKGVVDRISKGTHRRDLLWSGQRSPSFSLTVRREVPKTSQTDPDRK